MIRRTRYSTILLGLLGAFVLPLSAAAITAEDLKAALGAHKEKITIIDVRAPALYERGHIPNAINIPEEILGTKTLPELGRVIAVSDGLDPEFDAQVIATLNEKPGIEAESLEGGMARWNALGETTTEPAGLSTGEEPAISYERLKRIAAKNSNLVLIDARGNPESDAKRAKLEKGNARPDAEGKRTLVALADAFPGARSLRADFWGPAGKERDERVLGFVRGLDKTQRTTYVVIDDGFGDAATVLEALRKEGVRNCISLLGGDEVLRRDGKSERRVTQ